MTTERWQEVKDIFRSALELEPARRAAFLDQACAGDDSLRREVESLLRSHDESDSFMETPAMENTEAAKMIIGAQSKLQPGQRVGHYEIVKLAGEGGMGEVYLAHDNTLGRKVALKLLPASFTKDLDRLRRFEQEARSASALNHPNIITIYEIRKVSSSHMIVAEFVEGETLRQRLAHSPLSLAESLHVAIQVADALAAAHKAGIIHRDIKPENIMLRPDGYVKVLDFGLAKLAEHSPELVAAEAPTKQVRTGSGIVIGTAGYMSPEQARGVTVDARSDIFSLGAVIYEMIARCKPFEGETPSDVLAAVLKTDPHPISRFAPEAPAELVRIVTKTLRKDREERYQVVKDLLIDLRTLKQELDFQAKLEQSVMPEKEDSQATIRVTAATPATAGAPGTGEIKGAVTTITESLSLEIKRHKLGTAAILIALILLLTAGGFALYRSLQPTTQVAHFQTMKITRLTNSGKAIDATITPDGKYLIYSFSDAGKQSVWIRQVSTANDKQIVPPAPVGLFGITVSRDGNELYYAVKSTLDPGTLYRIPILGGTQVKILEKIDGPVSFSPDGKRFVLVRGNFPNQGESSLVIADADGSGEKTLAVRKPPERFTPIFFTGPSWSPDGKLIAVTVSSSDSQRLISAGHGSRVIAFGVEDGKEAVLTRDPWPFTARVEWLPDMSGLLVIGGEGVGLAQVWFVSYPGGERRRITNDLNAYRSIGLTSDGNKFATIQATGLINLWVVPEGDAKRAVQLPTGNVGFYSGSGNALSWTMDGHVVFVSNESGTSDIWLMDPDGTNRKQLTSNAGQNVSPVASPDGRYIIFTSTRGETRNVWRMNADGSNPKQLTTGSADFSPAVTPDSKWVIYASLGPTKWTVWKVSIDGGNAIELTNKPSNSPVVSPDGKFVAYFFPDSYDLLAPPNRMSIMPIEGGDPIKTFAIQGSGTTATVMQWAEDGHSILYTVNNANVTNIWSQPLDGGLPKRITDFKDSLITAFAWSRDGKQLACTRGILLRDAVLIADVK